MGVDGSGFERAGMLPNRLEEPLAASNQSAMTRKVDQELELERRERDGLVVYGHLVPGHIDSQSLELETIEGWLRLAVRAAQDGTQAKRQLSRAIGLRNEIVRAQLEREDTVDLRILTGNQNHRLGPGVRALADSLEHVGRPHVGQLVLDDQHGDFLLGQEPDGALTISGTLEIGTAGSQGLAQSLKQGVATSDDATIDFHHREELEERA